MKGRKWLPWSRLALADKRVGGAANVGSGPAVVGALARLVSPNQAVGTQKFIDLCGGDRYKRARCRGPDHLRRRQALSGI